MKTSSSNQPVSLSRKLDEALRQAFMLAQSRNPLRERDFSSFDQCIQEYGSVAKRFGGFELANSKIFEIGCGQRPYRLFTAIAAGYQASAIDVDRVLLGFSLQNAIDSMRTNGVERTTKTLLRYFFFDISENRSFSKHLLEKYGYTSDLTDVAIVQGDAAVLGNWPKHNLEFIYSEDVFEHIPQQSLDKVCACIAQRLNPNGLALIRPLVFTGIQGGHNVEYYDLDEHRRRNCPPWDHLLENRYPANTFLNQMTLSDYRGLFMKYFDIIDETVSEPYRGKNFMTQELRLKLAQWSDEELYSNHVRFVLRPRS